MRLAHVPVPSLFEDKLEGSEEIWLRVWKGRSDGLHAIAERFETEIESDAILGFPGVPL